MIIIEGEMPQYCMECPLLDREWNICNVVHTRKWGETKDGRPDNCPLKEVPTADVQEVKHAHWIVDADEGTARCSNCYDEFEDNGDTIPDYWNYCPHCGAKIDEKGA